MNSLNRVLLSILLPLLFSSALYAETDEQLAAIEEMGRLYGIALPCQYVTETRRIKQAMVSELPKKRYLGQLFEETTNTSFLAFVESAAACPGEGVFAGDVDIGMAELKRVFGD